MHAVAESICRYQCGFQDANGILERYSDNQLLRPFYLAVTFSPVLLLLGLNFATDRHDWIGVTKICDVGV